MKFEILLRYSLHSGSQTGSSELYKIILWNLFNISQEPIFCFVTLMKQECFPNSRSLKVTVEGTCVFILSPCFCFLLSVSNSEWKIHFINLLEIEDILLCGLTFQTKWMIHFLLFFKKPTSVFLDLIPMIHMNRSRHIYEFTVLKKLCENLIASTIFPIFNHCPLTHCNIFVRVDEGKLSLYIKNDLLHGFLYKLLFIYISCVHFS